MLALDPHYLKCTFYLYGSFRDAEDGVATGGCGFIASVKSRHPNWHYCYLVTNKHVIDGGNRSVRFNSEDGDTIVMETSPEEWTFAADADLAAIECGKPPDSEWLAIGTDVFVNGRLPSGWLVDFPR